MKRLLRNANIVNVFTDEIEQADVLTEDGIIVGVGDYHDCEADGTEDLTGKYLAPGLIDGHIHIESTMLLPHEFARVCALHGTSAVVADPHEIANVCGEDGISYMLRMSEKLPIDIFYALPSCVPATEYEESGAELGADRLAPFYKEQRVIALGEVMNYVGVIARDGELLKKIADAKAFGRVINGHAPLLSGRALDRYVAVGVGDDHECSVLDEALEKLRKGQRIMIRQGTAARNLEALLPLFDEPYSRRCLLVTDDKHPADLLSGGHIDEIIRRAAKAGKSPVAGIRMGSIQAAEYYGLKGMGAVAPGYAADMMVLDDLQTMTVRDVYHRGEKVVCCGRVEEFSLPSAGAALERRVRDTFRLAPLCERDFLIPPEKGFCRVIATRKGELITEERRMTLDFSVGNGIDVGRDILKIAVIERHNNTGHKGIGFLTGIGLKRGAIASSVAHDSHNLIVMGTNEADMAFAANRLRELGGGYLAVADGTVLAEMPLPVAGLMTDATAQEAAAQNRALKECVKEMGVPEGVEPFMTMAFVSLSVIPHLKLTTTGLVNVDRQESISLFSDEN